MFLPKIFQYSQTKICPSGQNVSIPSRFMLLTRTNPLLIYTDSPLNSNQKTNFSVENEKK